MPALHYLGWLVVGVGDPMCTSMEVVVCSVTLSRSAPPPRCIYLQGDAAQHRLGFQYLPNKAHDIARQKVEAHRPTWAPEAPFTG